MTRLTWAAEVIIVVTIAGLCGFIAGLSIQYGFYQGWLAALLLGLALIIRLWLRRGPGD